MSRMTWTDGLVSLLGECSPQLSAEEAAAVVSEVAGRPVTARQVYNARQRYGIAGMPSATRFGPGERPDLAAPEGAETTRGGRAYVKVGGEWVAKGRVEWERANGRPVPDGCSVVFANGDAADFDPRNLVAVDKRAMLVIARRRIPYCDRATLAAAVAAATAFLAVRDARMRPRECPACGASFAPRYERQRRCDACLGRAGRADEEKGRGHE